MAEIRIVPYDPDWPARFELEAALLDEALGPWLDGGIHHIGSTAIPGMAAKPTIDMMAGVADLEQALAAFPVLVAAGYEHTPHRPGTHHFSKGAAPAFAYGLHLTRPGSDLWRERLAFRDALRLDPTLAAEYEALKLSLAGSRGGYTVSKRPFVARVLALAGISIPPVSPR